jgi:sarcosine oxidase
MANDFDVIVVGLGAMGSATLYQLARLGVRALGIDQFVPPHEWGSTHGETRITRLAVGEGAAYVPLARRSHEIWRELAAASGEQLLQLTGGYIICPRQGGAQFHGAGDFVQRSAQLAVEHGIAHELRDAAAVRAHMPLLKMGDDEHSFFEPTGGVVSPERAVTVQLRLAQQLGAMVQTGEKVVALRPSGDGVVVQTAQGSYTAGKVVLTAGPWVGDFWRREGEKRPFSVYRQVFYWFEAEDLEQFRPERFPWVIWIGDTLADFYSAFPAPLGTRAAVKMVTEEYLAETHPDEVARTVRPEEIAYMHDYFIQRRLAGLTANCVGAKVCLYTVTPDEGFVVDWHPESERVLLASPCSGHGFKHSAALGEAMAQLVTQGESGVDLRPFSLSRFG